MNKTLKAKERLEQKNRSLTKAQDTIAQLKSDLGKERDEKNKFAAERDKYQLAQAFLANAAAQIYTNEPPERQIELMLERIQGLEKTVSETAKRIPKPSNLVGDQAQQSALRIVEKLLPIPPGQIHIQNASQNNEDKIIVARLVDIFSYCKWKVMHGSFMIPSALDEKKVEIRLKSEASIPMRALIEQIATETGKEAFTKVGDTVFKHPNGATNVNDIWIVVGPPRQ